MSGNCLFGMLILQNTTTHSDLMPQFKHLKLSKCRLSAGEYCLVKVIYRHLLIYFFLIC